jgi:hypothetical protein
VSVWERRWWQLAEVKVYYRVHSEVWLRIKLWFTKTWHVLTEHVSTNVWYMFVVHCFSLYSQTCSEFLLAYVIKLDLVDWHFCCMKPRSILSPSTFSTQVQLIKCPLPPALVRIDWTELQWAFVCSWRCYIAGGIIERFTVLISRPKFRPAFRIYSSVLPAITNRGLSRSIRPKHIAVSSLHDDFI